MVNDLIEINIDVVRELRSQGRGMEAAALVKAHLESVKKAGKDAYNDEMRINRRIKASKKVCFVDGCYNKVIKTSMCESCREKKREYYNKRNK